MSNTEKYNTWIPISLPVFEKIVSRRIKYDNSQCYQYGLNKNICYNLQYLEFVSKHCFSELNLTAVLEKQNYKMFIVVATSIIEGILYYEIKESGLTNNGWKLFRIFKSNPLNVNNKLVKIESHYFEKGYNVDKAEMRFEQMLKIAEKNKLLGDKHIIYGKIKTLRSLRNKIHIHIAKNNIDTDYNSFNKVKFALAKSSLMFVLEEYFILKSDEKNEYFKFLLD